MFHTKKEKFYKCVTRNFSIMTLLENYWFIDLSKNRTDSKSLLKDISFIIFVFFLVQQ